MRRAIWGRIGGGGTHSYCVAGGVAIALLYAGWASAEEGTSARLYRMASDPDGVGTVDGAHAPPSGVAVFGLGADVSRYSVAKWQEGIRHDRLKHRQVVEPMVTFGLPSAFALTVRVPVATYDYGFEADARTPLKAGLLPPSMGVLVPLVRVPATNTRVSARVEAFLPTGRPAAFKGDGGFSGRGTLVFGGPIGPLYSVLSAGVLLAPERRLEDASLKHAAIASVGLRIPKKSAIAFVASVDSRVELQGSYAAYALPTGGMDLRLGSTNIRMIGGPCIGDTMGSPRVWIGLSILQSVELFPSYQYFSQPPQR